MKLSSKGRYGLLALYDLAVRYGGGPVSIKAIAARNEIPELYLEQLFLPLRRKGLIQSVRGAQGGYELTRPPNEVVVGDALRALEGTTALIECVEKDGCGSECSCPSRFVWKRVQQGIDSAVNSITLQDMLDDMLHKTKETKIGEDLS